MMIGTLFHATLRSFLRSSTVTVRVSGERGLAIGTLNGREHGAPSTVARPVRRVEVTEENVQRIFGISMQDLFKELARKFGYTIED